MEFSYEERHPAHQFAFVFNINRCIACQTCTMACKSTWTFGRGQEHMWWNNVETKPYGGYPRHWDARLLAMLDRANPGKQVWEAGAAGSAQAPYGRFAGKTVFEAAQGYAGPEGPKRALGYIPAPEEWDAPNIFEDHARSGPDLPNGQRLGDSKVWFFYLARLCNHCTYPACLGACPRQAIYKRPEDGVVLIDQSRCNGYQKCVEACPYKKAMFRPATGTSEKCVACYPRLEGKDPLLSPGAEPAETRCMTSCVGKIRLQGLVAIDADGTWTPDPTNPIYYLVRERQIALPLYPQFGTEPNGFYIPPRWVPRPYLEQMFGPGVKGAIDQYSCPDRELLAVLQLFRKTNRIIYRYKIEEGPKVYETEIHGRKFEQWDDTVIGYGKNGEELVRTNVNEPVHVRPGVHQNSI
jgi:nitrate reductase beta subunit